MQNTEDIHLTTYTLLGFLSVWSGGSEVRDGDAKLKDDISRKKFTSSETVLLETLVLHIVS